MNEGARIPFKKAKTTVQITTEKLERKHVQEQQRRIKPGQCLKYIQVVIDPEFLAGQQSSKVLGSLADLGVKFEVRVQKAPRTVTWERSEQQTLVASAENFGLTDKYVPEKQMLVLRFAEELVAAMKDKTLRSDISGIKRSFPDMSITLIIFGLRNFCRSNPTIRRMEIEKCLVELQVLHGCNHRLLETADEVAAIVSQFSKAVAEIPFKKQQANKFEDANLFLLNDNRDCVRVEGSAGLSRLWQQSLTRLPLVTLETAEAIMTTYPCPKILIEEFENNPEAADSLTDLKIRRAAGPLSAVRRVGPELSRKVHTLYTSLDPNEKL